MKIKTSEATPAQINWLVSQINGYTYRMDEKYGLMVFVPHAVDSILVSWSGEFPDYCGDWAFGGPIIEKEEVEVSRYWNKERGDARAWKAQCGPQVTHCYGPTPLIAAMRCFVASKLGDEVEIPEDLM